MPGGRRPGGASAGAAVQVGGETCRSLTERRACPALGPLPGRGCASAAPVARSSGRRGDSESPGGTCSGKIVDGFGQDNFLLGLGRDACPTNVADFCTQACADRGGVKAVFGCSSSHLYPISSPPATQRRSRAHHGVGSRRRPRLSNGLRRMGFIVGRGAVAKRMVFETKDQR
jgi:hypothetical protein